MGASASAKEASTAGRTTDGGGGRKALRLGQARGRSLRLGQARGPSAADKTVLYSYLHLNNPRLLRLGCAAGYGEEGRAMQLGQDFYF